MNNKRSHYRFFFIFLGIILFFLAITIWWISLANPDLMIWSIILFFISILIIINILLFALFDIQKRLEKLELIYKIKEMESESPIKSIDIKIVSLNNWEKRIINLLKENHGELTQMEIGNLTGLSRSNLSNHISSLEKKDIIRKEPFQRTNKIILLKNVLD
ncbi:MAG TPA: MarR family transcriptional regulator [Candidatus Deferrimicrobium sp.]|nr:MarR family transcriptional regulator [Candidatus Deferrimicrobium sp.]